jgi:rubredoxin
MSEPYKIWQCLNCGYIYSEEDGDPAEGLSPGTRWADLPDDWYCPQCGSGKEDFEMAQIG